MRGPHQQLDSLSIEEVGAFLSQRSHFSTRRRFKSFQGTFSSAHIHFPPPPGRRKKNIPSEEVKCIIEKEKGARAKLGEGKFDVKFLTLRPRDVSSKGQIGSIVRMGRLCCSVRTTLSRAHLYISVCRDNRKTLAPSTC